MYRLAKVVNVNPQAHTADIVMMDTADRVSNVQVIAGYVSTTSGALSLPAVTQPSQAYSVQDTGKCDVYAYVIFARHLPLIIGFKVPELGQMTFADGRQIHRHDSDVYTSLTRSGDFEMAWPNGLYVRVASSPAHEDLTGRDYDGQWKTTQNADAQLHVVLGLPNGAGSIRIDPEGNATLALASLTVTTPEVTLNGNFQLNGTLTATEDVQAGAISLKDHVHTQVQSGTSTSGGPEG